MRIAVCSPDRHIIKTITDCISMCRGSYKYSIFMSSRALLTAVIKNKEYFEVIFIDKQTEYPNGITATKYIFQISYPKPIIITISPSAIYELHHCEIAFRDFSIPLSYSQIQDILQIAFSRFTPPVFRVARYGEKIYIPITDINYFEVRGVNVTVFSTLGNYTFRGTLREVENILSGEIFFRPHISYLVNIARVKAVLKKEIMLLDKTVLPLSRTHKKAFLQHVDQFLGLN